MIYWILRFWRPKDGMTFYAYDDSHPMSDGRRHWWRASERARAYKFDSVQDAKRTLKAPFFQKKIKPWAPDQGWDGDPPVWVRENVYYWEILKITEREDVVVHEELVDSNVPGMLLLARASMESIKESSK